MQYLGPWLTIKRLRLSVMQTLMRLRNGVARLLKSRLIQTSSASDNVRPYFTSASIYKQALTDTDKSRNDKCIYDLCNQILFGY